MILLLFDIGGTKFRYYIYDYYNDYIIDYYSVSNVKDIFRLFKNCIMFVNTFYILENIYVSIAGIVDNYNIYGCNNLKLKDNKLIEKYYNIKINYINDGDVFIIGEVKYNMLNKRHNILGLYFGTGIACGLIINNNLIHNAESHRYMETFMKKNILTNNNIDSVCKYLGNEISNLVELLNLDYIIINGYVNNFKEFPNKLKNNLNYNKYYEPEFIFSDCNIPIIYGLVEIKNWTLTNGG